MFNLQSGLLTYLFGLMLNLVGFDRDINFGLDLIIFGGFTCEWILWWMALTGMIC